MQTHKFYEDFHSKIINNLKDCFKLRIIKDWRKFTEKIAKIKNEFHILKAENDPK
jgi:hypothetical protein